MSRTKRHEGYFILNWEVNKADKIKDFSKIMKGL